MRTLITTTIHAAIDYGVAAWMPLKIPQYYLDKLSVIDHTCARAALGALKSTPTAFLDHNLGLTPPKVRLQAKIVQFIAKALTKPTHHPAHHFAAQATHVATTPLTTDSFSTNCATPLTSTLPKLPLTRQSNYTTLIRQDEERAKSEAKHLKPSAHHLVIYTDGSRLPK